MNLLGTFHFLPIAENGYECVLAKVVPSAPDSKLPILTASPDDRFADIASTGSVESKTDLKTLPDGDKPEMRDVHRGRLDKHGRRLRNRNRGGKTSIPKVSLIDACEVS